MRAASPRALLLSALLLAAGLASPAAAGNVNIVVVDGSINPASADYIQQAMSNAHLSGNGPFTKKCQAWLEERVGCCKVLLTHSCTAALEMAAILVLSVDAVFTNPEGSFSAESP